MFSPKNLLNEDFWLEELTLLWLLALAVEFPSSPWVVLTVIVPTTQQCRITTHSAANLIFSKTKKKKLLHTLHAASPSLQRPKIFYDWQENKKTKTRRNMFAVWHTRRQLSRDINLLKIRTRIRSFVGAARCRQLTHSPRRHHRQRNRQQTESGNWKKNKQSDTMTEAWRQQNLCTPKDKPTSRNDVESKRFAPCTYVVTMVNHVAYIHYSAHKLW